MDSRKDISVDSSSENMSAVGHQKFHATKLTPFPFHIYPSLFFLLSLSLLAAALAGVITVRNDGAGAARPSCSLRSLRLHTSTFLCLSTFKTTHIHVQHHVHTHTYLLNAHLPGQHMASRPLMVSLYFSFSLWTGVCSPAGVSVIACRGEEKLDLSAPILCMSLLVLYSLHLSQHRGV